MSKPYATARQITPVAVKLDANMKNRLQALAQSRQRTTHWLLKEAVAQFVYREEQHEALRRDALRAWGDYQETGLHVSAQEADEWLAQLEQGHEVAPPKPHV